MVTPELACGGVFFGVRGAACPGFKDCGDFEALGGCCSVLGAECCPLEDELLGGEDWAGFERGSALDDVDVMASVVAVQIDSGNGCVKIAISMSANIKIGHL